MSKPKNTAASTGRICVLILGMHRSGTSALAGVLSRLGCALPAHEMPPSKSNAKGFFESIAIRDLNDELLASAGSSWDDFTDFRDDWRASPQGVKFADRAVSVLQTEFGGAELFVLKDPRICRLVPFWSEALERVGCAVKPILTIRNPLDVGQSLVAKRGLSEPVGQMLWLRHALDAEQATRGMLRYHTSFEQLMEGWEIVANQAQRSLELIWPKSPAAVEFEVESFLSGDLRHHQDSSARIVASTLLPKWLRDSYGILSRWAECGESPEDYSTLDRIKAEFDIATNAFGRVVRAEREINAEQKQKSDELKQTAHGLQTELQELATSAKHQQAALEKAMDNERSVFEARRASLSASVEQEKAARKAERKALEKAQEQRAIRDTEYKMLRKQLETQKSAFDAKREALVSSIEKEKEARAADRTAFEKAIEEQRTARAAAEERLISATAAAERQRSTLEEQLAQIAALNEQQSARIDEQKASAEVRQTEFAAEVALLESRAEQKIAQMRRSLEEQRRRNTLLDADLHQLTEALEASEFQVTQSRSELAASQGRRKEAARVIANRDAEIRTRFEELAVLERQIIESSLTWKARERWRRTSRWIARPRSRKAYS